MSVQGHDHVIVVEGQVSKRPWRLEVGDSTRNYIMGDEIRGRSDLGLPDDVTILVMNRHLKDWLERKAFSVITDSTQTKAEPSLPEEMRWLAMYDEVGWDGLSPAFWRRYSVLAHRREHALAWLVPEFADMLMDWPEPAPRADVPFILLLMRGRAFLRMGYPTPDAATLQHVGDIFASACESAVGTFAGMPGFSRHA
ncbi:MAG: hypothetical protein HY854_22105 [Burkholderiales bacterium]|nr:hypothetical protein [Burkholderiales bacterium]